MHVTATGLAAGVHSLSARRLTTSAHGGAFLESLALNETMRQAASIDEPLNFAHFRDRGGPLRMRPVCRGGSSRRDSTMRIWVVPLSSLSVPLVLVGLLLDQNIEETKSRCYSPGLIVDHSSPSTSRPPRRWGGGADHC